MTASRLGQLLADSTDHVVSFRARRRRAASERALRSGGQRGGALAGPRRRAVGAQSERRLRARGGAHRLLGCRQNGRGRAADVARHARAADVRRRHRVRRRHDGGAQAHRLAGAGSRRANRSVCSRRAPHSGCSPRARPACRRKPAAGSSTSSTSSTALEAVFGASLGAGRVFATVSHRHVYGLLFRILWPLLERRPFATFDCEYPEQLLGAVGSGNVLISSPAMLKRIGHLPARSGQWRAVFSSGGFLPADAAADVTRVLGAEAVEVLGSTETSGVAWRTASSPGFRAATLGRGARGRRGPARGAFAVRG